MKTPEDIKMGLEYASTTNIARKVMLAKAGKVPYAYMEEVATDALALIRQLESKLAEYEKPLEPLPEVQIYNDPVWLEMRAENVELRIVDIVPAFDDPGNKAEIMLLGNPRRAHLPYTHYGSSWRCWSRRPTDEERKAEKWDE